ARDDDVLLAGVQPLGVLADDDEVHVPVGDLDPRQGRDGPDAGVEVQLLAQGHVDGAEALAHGRGTRALEGDAGAAAQVERGRRPRARVTGGSGSPKRSGAPRPAQASTQVRDAPAAWTTARMAAVTSGPMPSPAISTTGVVTHLSRGLTVTGCGAGVRCRRPP